MSRPAAVALGPQAAVRDPDASAVNGRAQAPTLPSEEAIESLTTVFGLLADPGRLRLLTALLADRELCVCDLAAATGSSESSVSHALRLLRANRVVRVRRAGRRAYYRLDDAHVRLLLDVALAHSAHGDDAAAAGAP